MRLRPMRRRIAGQAACIVEALAGPNGLDRHRLDHQAAIGHQERKTLAIRSLELGTHGVDGAEGDHERGVGALVAHVNALSQLDRGDALCEQLVACRTAELAQATLRRCQTGGVERQFDRPLAHRDLVGQAHAVGRQHAGQRMHEHARHAQGIGHRAGMLPAGTAETLQRVLRDVVAAGHRDALDRVGHVLHRDLHKACGQRFGRHVAPGAALDVGGHRLEFGDHARAVERLVAARPEHLGKVRALDAAKHHVGVGHRQRTAAPIARRPRVGTGALGPDAQPRAVELQDRAAAGGHRVDAHHRRAHAHAGHLGFERALEFAREVADVGGRAAHVEADHSLVPTGHRGAHHADDAARRARQDRILALEVVRFGEATARLHEEQAHAGHLRGHLVDVAAQDRRQVRVDHRGVAARHQLHQRAHLVRHADLRESDGTRQRGCRLLVCGEAVAVHEDNRAGADAGVEGGLQLHTQRVGLQRLHHLALRADTLVGFDDPFVQQLGQHDVAIEQARPILIGDAQRIAKAARGHQHRAVALALEQRVGGHRGAHLHAVHLRGRDRLAGLQAQQTAHAFDRGIAILLRVVRQQFQRAQRTVGGPPHDVGEGAAAVDPELPAWRNVHALASMARHRSCSRLMMWWTGRRVARATALA